MRTRSGPGPSRPAAPTPPTSSIGRQPGSCPSAPVNRITSSPGPRRPPRAERPARAPQDAGGEGQLHHLAGDGAIRIDLHGHLAPIVVRRPRFGCGIGDLQVGAVGAVSGVGGAEAPPARLGHLGDADQVGTRTADADVFGTALAGRIPQRAARAVEGVGGRHQQEGPLRGLTPVAARQLPGDTTERLIGEREHHQATRRHSGGRGHHLIGDRAGHRVALWCCSLRAARARRQGEHDDDRGRRSPQLQPRHRSSVAPVCSPVLRDPSPCALSCAYVL